MYNCHLHIYGLNNILNIYYIIEGIQNLKWSYNDMVIIGAYNMYLLTQSIKKKKLNRIKVYSSQTWDVTCIKMVSHVNISQVSINIKNCTRSSK